MSLTSYNKQKFGSYYTTDSHDVQREFQDNTGNITSAENALKDKRFLFILFGS